MGRLAHNTTSESWSHVLPFSPLKFFVILWLEKLHSGCVSGTTLYMDFNFSSTYSESSIMRSATCSAD